MTKQKLTLSLDSEIIEKLKVEAERSGVSASALITIMLTERLEGTRPNQSDSDLLGRLESYEDELELLWKTLGSTRPAKVKQLSTGNFSIVKIKND